MAPSIRSEPALKLFLIAELRYHLGSSFELKSNSIMTIISTRLFTWRQILVYTAVFVGGFIAVQRMLRFTCANWVAFDCPDYWPVSIFTPRLPSLRDLFVAAIVGVTF